MILLVSKSNLTNERFRQNGRGVAVDLSDKKFFFGCRPPAASKQRECLR